MIALQALGELSPQEVLSPAEERFERIRRRSGFVIAPGLFVLFMLLPFEGLSRDAHILAGEAQYPNGDD